MITRSISNATNPFEIKRGASAKMIDRKILARGVCLNTALRFYRLKVALRKAVTPFSGFPMV